MIQSLPSDYNNFAASYAATQQAKPQKTKEKSLKARFTDFLRKDKAELAAMEGMPPEIMGLATEAAVAYLLDQTTMAAEALKRSPLPEQFAEYRKRVSQFLRYVEREAYGIEEVVLRPNTRYPKARKKYVLTLIDQKLDALARDILFNQAEQLEMLARIDEINGLLIDLIS